MLIVFAYDALGNITSIKENGVVQVSYEYDAYNQLVKETYQNGDVIEYSYDNGGNLLSKTVNGVVSNSYTYGDTEWKDLLTGFNGTTITYDEIGNPQNWRDGMSFTWVNGRQLGALQKGDLNVSYSYNSDGLRVSKTVNGVKTEYVWDGSSLIGQKTGNNVLVYLYAADGLAGFQYNGVNYYYLRNGQGDVVAILNASGNIVAKYAYDAWGKLLSVTDAAGNDKSADASFIGNINPIRYRSYYYDTETGLYYLQSRYYDPEVGRFINADGILGANQDILSYNLFAYCSNNPINFCDSTGRGIGEFFKGIWDGITGYVNGFINDYTYLNYEDDAKEKYNEDTISINGSDPSAPIQVTINPENTNANGCIDPDIRIEDSYKIKSQYEKEAVLDVIFNSDEFDSSVFTRSKIDYITEWNAHNNFYALFSWTPWGDNARDVDLNELDRGKQIAWDILGYVDLS